MCTNTHFPGLAPVAPPTVSCMLIGVQFSVVHALHMARRRRFSNAESCRNPIGPLPRPCLVKYSLILVHIPFTWTFTPAGSAWSRSGKYLQLIMTAGMAVHTVVALLTSISGSVSSGGFGLPQVELSFGHSNNPPTNSDTFGIISRLSRAKPRADGSSILPVQKSGDLIRVVGVSPGNDSRACSSPGELKMPRAPGCGGSS